MSKLNNLRDEKGIEVYPIKHIPLSDGSTSVDLNKLPREVWENGAKWYEALNLPVLFMEYSANLISTRKDGHILHLLPEVSKQDRWYTEQELYDYWINNIFNK